MFIHTESVIIGIIYTLLALGTLLRILGKITYPQRSIMDFFFPPKKR